jgi:hypothetical protein
LIPTIACLLFDFLSMKTDISSKSNKQTKNVEENLFFVGILLASYVKSRIRIRKPVVRIRRIRIRAKIVTASMKVDFLLCLFFRSVTIAEQPVGFASGRQSALERISSLR